MYMIVKHSIIFDHCLNKISTEAGSSPPTG